MRRQQRSTSSKTFLSGFLFGCAFFLLTRFAVVPCFWSVDRAIPAGVESRREDASTTPAGITDENLVLIGVMSAKQFLESRVIPGFDTWATAVPGKVIVFSSEGSSLPHRPDIPLISLPGIDDSYPPQHKSFAMLKYMYDHYRNKFRFFMRADDDVYIRGDVLRPFLHSINSTDRPLYIGQAGLGTKEELGQLSLKHEENFCMGGPGVILTQETLVRVAPHISYCLQHLLTSHEDVELGRCIHRFAGVTCTWSYEKGRVKPVYRRTLSAAELYNLPLPELSHPSSIFTDSHIRTLREHLPARADGRSWLLVYSSDRDGFSLQTLYRHSCAHTNCPVLLIIRDQLLHIFGAMLPCELRLSETFYGSGELFLFTFFPSFKKYGWSGMNSYFIKGNTDSLTVGAADGVFGLWLDDCLYRGRTDRCDTFDNEPLTDTRDFIIDCLEAWSFQ